MHGKLELEMQERRERQVRQQQYEIKKLELEMSRASYPFAQPTDPPSVQPSPSA